MIIKFEIQGLWFLPENKEKRVPGTLRFDPVEGATLELIGSFDDFGILHRKHQSEAFIILGLSINSEYITLYNCFNVARRGQTYRKGNESGPAFEKYIVNFILKGHHFETEESLQFNEIKSSMQNFDEWLNITGFKHSENIDNLSEKSIRVDYKLPENIAFELHDKFTGKFVFSSTSPTYSSLKLESITQHVEIEIGSSENIPLEDIRKLLARFQNFLIMGIYRSVFPTSITLYNSNIKNDYGQSGKYRKPIEFFQTTSKRKTRNELHPWEMLFNYKKIENLFPIAIKNWFEKYEKLKPAFSLLFEQFYNESKFSENTFLNLAQALETLHARLYNHTKIPKKDYTEMKTEILNSTPAKYHPWLNEQFNFGNHLNLHQRLNELIDKYSNETLKELIPDQNAFVKQIKDLRNYYTHYSTGLEKHLISERDLMLLSERMKLVLVIGLLHEIGFPKETVDHLLEKVKNNFNHLKVE
ncbi:HEPN domain-containing protein [Flavobacterium ovatum]|uniref:ApeA N-terminal domain 1-containing protein n=1 Tax=Flavobacterium ovatum TaxID=1928857 RepID=UPI00344F877A